MPGGGRLGQTQARPCRPTGLRSTPLSTPLGRNGLDVQATPGNGKCPFFLCKSASPYPPNRLHTVEAAGSIHATPTRQNHEFQWFAAPYSRPDPGCACSFRACACFASPASGESTFRCLPLLPRGLRHPPHPRFLRLAPAEIQSEQLGQSVLSQNLGRRGALLR